MLLFDNPFTGPDGELYNADQGMREILSDYYLTGTYANMRDAFLEGVKCRRIWPVEGSTELSRAVAPPLLEEVGWDSE